MHRVRVQSKLHKYSGGGSDEEDFVCVIVDRVFFDCRSNSARTLGMSQILAKPCSGRCHHSQ